MVQRGCFDGVEDVQQRCRATTKVVEGLFVLSGGGANLGVSIGDDGVLMVDAGVAVATDKVKAAVAALDPRPPRIVLDTNWHFDHADGNEAMAALGATVVAHPRSRPHMLQAAEIVIRRLRTPTSPPVARGGLSIFRVFVRSCADTPEPTIGGVAGERQDPLHGMAHRC